MLAILVTIEQLFKHPNFHALRAERLRLLLKYLRFFVNIPTQTREM